MLSFENGIPMINYGIILAYLNGIIDRTMKPLEMLFKNIYSKLIKIEVVNEIS